MKLTLTLLLLVSSATASALQQQTLIIGEGEFNQTRPCQEQTEEDAKLQAVASAEAQCADGTLKQLTDFGKVIKKPVNSFCYPTWVVAVFECLQTAKASLEQ